MAGGSPLEMRAMAGDETEEWLDLLGEAFAAKGTPRSFFEGHMKCDPWFDAAGVRLCIDPAAATATAAAGAVSTIRVYTRWIHADGAELRVGAIGDVATATSHRRRGLAGQCIRDAIEHMQATGCTLSVLHTSKRTLAGYYGGQGFIAVPVKSSVYRLDRDAVDLAAAGLPADRGQPSKLHPEQDWFAGLSMVATMHSDGASRLKGCFKRSEDYWLEWLYPGCSGDGGSRLWVLDGDTPAYALFRMGKGPVFGGVLQCHEFFAKDKLPADQKRVAFLLLLNAALADNAAARPDRLMASPCLVNPEWMTALFTPVDAKGECTPAADNSTLMIAEGAAPLGVDEWSDEGHLYRIIDPKGIPGAEAGDPAAALEAYFGDGTHAFLNADSF